MHLDISCMHANSNKSVMPYIFLKSVVFSMIEGMFDFHVATGLIIGALYHFIISLDNMNNMLVMDSLQLDHVMEAF